MVKIKGHARLFAILLFLSFAVAAIFSMSPARTGSAEAAASETLGAMLSRNDKLVVKYSLDETATAAGQKLAAYTWDAETQTYVVAPEFDATIQNGVNGGAIGEVRTADGVEGSSALSFTGKAHARAKFHLPQDADGMTVSIWVKNITTYWGSLVEFWDGAHGGRLGKGTMQGNGGRRNEADPWDQNCAAHAGDVHASVEGGGWDSFVVTHNNTNGDNGGDAVDNMKADTWYQVTYVITSTEMKAYRDGVLKQHFTSGQTSHILGDIMTAAKNQTDGMFGIRLAHDSTEDRPDILDDLRIYSGAMSQEEVTGLYEEYRGVKAANGKTVRLDGTQTSFTLDNGGNFRFTSSEAGFPKILIGGVEAGAVTEQGGTYSATGDGFSYTYTISGNVATVVFTETATQAQRVFTVTKVSQSADRITLSSLKIKIDGKAEDVEGFDPEKTRYTVTLSPDTASVSFEVTVSGGGTSNVETVNENINCNGENVITTSAGTAGGESVSYTVILKRERADAALPTVNGVKLDYSSQLVYTDEPPADLEQSCVTPEYPNGVTIEGFSYDKATHVVTFTLQDKLLKESTEYTLSYKSKNEGHIAHWSFEESVGGENKVFAGSSWDAQTGALKENEALNMTVRSTSWNTAVTDTRTPTAARKVSGVIGEGIELGSWGYTTANIPAVGGTTGFTFSTWMKLEGIVWEAVFSVNGSEHGTILEKGNMQKHDIANGQPIGGWEHLSNSVGEWKDPALSSDDAKKDYFNTPSAGAQYVFFTVTVTYQNGVSEIKFYKDGELAVTFNGQDGSAAKAQVLIEAINGGASVGLHRHHMDGENSSRFDETNIYAYAQTAEEIKASYETIAELLAAAPEYYEAEGLAYPDLLLGGATEVKDSQGVKTGVTQSGISYSYTPLTGPATAELDEQGVKVTLSKNDLSRTATVKFNRDLGLKAEKLGYKLGENGENVNIPVPEDPTEDILVKVPAGADLSEIKAGENVVQMLEGDQNAEHYKADFSYSESSHIATVRCYHIDFPTKTVYYNIVFAQKNTATFISMQVSGGKEALTLTPENFAGGSVNVPVESLTSFELHITLTLAEGATANVKQTYTQSDLADGKLSIAVTNENGDTVTYSLVPVAISSDVTLSALTLEGYTLSPAFSPEKTEYTLTVDKGEGVKVLAALTATPSNSKATVKKSYDLASGVITLTVTAEDGTVGFYTITITEQDTDATLRSLEAGGVSVEGFAPETLEYTVKYKGELPAVTAAAASESAVVSVGAAQDGVVKITVTAENGAQKVYTVTLVKMSSDASIVKVTVGGAEVTFTGTNGTCTLPAGTRLETSPIVIEVAEGVSVSHRIEGGNKLYITVTAEDGTAVEYTVSVTFSSGSSLEGGTTEDNSPAVSGCGGVVSGTALLAAVLLGAGLMIGKKRKTH